MHKKTILNSTKAVLGGITLALSSVSFAADTWDMPLAYSASNYHSVIAKEFAEQVTGAQDEIEVITHPSGSLFKGGEIYSSVRRGLAPIGERLISALSNEDPIYSIDAVPFLATDFDSSWRLYQASKPAMEEVLKKHRLKLLYSIPWPPQGLYASKEINSVADMKGLTFRAYNPATSKIAEMMGAIPTKVEAAEVSQAFATGVAESMLSSGSTGYDQKLWEHVDYWYDVKAWLPKNMVFVNVRAWNQLSPETQDVILKASADAEKKGWAKARELADWYKKELAANGMTVQEASPKLKSDLQAIGVTMTNDWLKEAGEKGQSVIEAYKAM
ncbi:C4-dicarboxylate ABC transporter substrate-binding protein [Marinomonas piezotolerans]|uniref:C4-dicarboxylate ABC transporter substrate-binding protein n=1 Tax=Marinomonas piezotolerans TaxID=2213058 RepID=A0A370UBQ4_9GAMM|nr:TRAP transporter substrate-binding protein [Marinomonas piezotolerans]RDL45204.1 C4-dicarboxylate ABC transporter substrate-binding protein [Marinomonas piezotolerans]